MPQIVDPDPDSAELIQQDREVFEAGPYEWVPPEWIFSVGYETVVTRDRLWEMMDVLTDVEIALSGEAQRYAKRARRLGGLNVWIGLPSTVAAAVSGVAVVADIPWLAAGLALLVAAAGAALGFLNPAEESRRSKRLSLIAANLTDRVNSYWRTDIADDVVRPGEEDYDTVFSSAFDAAQRRKNGFASALADLRLGIEPDLSEEDSPAPDG